MTPTATAKLLASELGGQVERWSFWLANDRRSTRVTKLLPTIPGIARPTYLRAQVNGYIVMQRAADAAKSKPAKPRSFTPHISGIPSADETSAPSVLLVTVNPIRTYELSLAEARQIAARLIRAVADAESGEPSEQP